MMSLIVKVSDARPHLSTRPYARLVHRWVDSIGLVSKQRPAADTEARSAAHFGQSRGTKAIAEGSDPKVITEAYASRASDWTIRPGSISSRSQSPRLRLAAVLIPRFAPHQRAVK